MKRQLLIAAIFQLIISACGQNSKINQLNAIEFNKLVSEHDVMLIDVRTKQEFENGHIKNAKLINIYQADFKQKLLLLPKDKEIYVYCYSGARSSNAANILLENGYSKVFNLQRGIIEWNANNLQLVKGAISNQKLENSYTLSQYKTLIKSDELVFIDFYAPWCAPCRKMMPMVDSLKVKYQNRIKIVKINTDASKQLMKELNIKGVPYLSLFHNGEMIFSKSGIINRKELTAIFDSEILKLSK